MKRTKTKFLTIFLSFCMIISCMVGMSVTASADAPLEWTNGNVIATLDGTKLTVEKKPDTDGAMDNNGWTAVGTTTWNSVRGAITEVEIQDGVTSIGTEAFEGCLALTRVTIPNGVTSIGNYAFNGCSALTSVKIPNGVTSIGMHAFYGCSSLTTVTIPGSVTIIEINTFNGCSDLTSVTIPGSVTSIGVRAFESCSALTSVTIPSKVVSIGERAFLSCGNLATVTFEPRSTEDINNNNSLSIGADAFTNTATGAATGAKVAYGLGASILYDGTTEIKAGDALTKIYSKTEEKTLTWKKDDSVKAWTNGDVIAFLDNETHKLTVSKRTASGSGEMGDSWQPEGSAALWTDVRGSITAVEIQDGVTSIGNSAFRACGDLESVTIPSSVTSIEDNTFFECYKLKSLTIPSSVTSIGDSAFYACSYLTSVTIPSSVTSIGDSAFQNCWGLESVTIPGSVTSIGGGAFDSCSALTSVTFIPGTAGATLSIGESAFNNTANGTKVAYGAGSTVLNDGTNNITTDTLLTDIQNKTLTWKAVAVTDVTLDKTTAEIEVGKTETLTATVKPDNAADKTVTWTSSDEGVATVANGVVTAVAAGTATITAKAGDKTATCEVTVKSVSPEPEPEPTPTPTPPPYYPTYIPTPTTPTVDIKNYNITGTQDETNENALTWDAIPDASAYSLYIMVDGKYVYIQDLGTATNADVVRATNGKYYVSTGGDYTIYEYDSKTGKFTNTGTLEASKIDSIKKANNVTENFMVKYTVYGKESTESNSYKVSVEIYYKPALGITAGDGFIRVNWAKVDGAEKYRAYKYVNGKLKFIIETDKLALRVNGTKAGREYAYAVKAFVDGEWTKVYKSDIKKVTAK